MACDAHGASKPDAEKDADDADWEELDARTTKPTDAEQERQAFETNSAETVIAVDHSTDPGLLETFTAFQTKLHALQEAAARVMAAAQRHATEVVDSASSISVDAACASAAAIGDHGRGSA